MEARRAPQYTRISYVEEIKRAGHEGRRGGGPASFL